MTIAQQLVAAGKGILAADESVPTMTKRLSAVGVESTLENRTTFRQIIFDAPNLGDYISGVILFDETIRDARIREILANQGIIPGIKVDKGVVSLPKSKDLLTEGLDGLSGRLKEYATFGAKFAKWRAVYSPDPSVAAIRSNAFQLAIYALYCQEQDIVPIVEPEVLMDGDHDISQSVRTTNSVLAETFYRLQQMQVDFSNMILKPNMILPGYKCPKQVPKEEIAQKTIDCLKELVPDEVAGVAFLSGGQEDEVATTNLNAINQFKGKWPLTFSFGRGLQAAALKMWQGKPENAQATQEAVIYHAKRNSLASLGKLG